MGVMAASLRLGGSDGGVIYIGNKGEDMDSRYALGGGKRIELAGGGFCFMDIFRDSVNSKDRE